MLVINRRWQTIERLFHAARELDPENRRAFLEQSCGHDISLRSSVQRLLDHDAKADNFLALPAIEMVEPTLAPGLRLGPYEVANLVGSGGMGRVYRAWDIRLKRDVAIKALPFEFANDSDRLAKLEREATLLASLNHPNIPVIYDVVEHRGGRYLVLEFVEGQTLDFTIAARSLDLNEIVGIGRQIAEALKAAHSRHIVHRDIKPANVAITPQGQVKVLDFGIAMTERIRSETTADSTQEMSLNVILGTFQYMSPEQALGQDLDSRTDIFSLGIVLYEMATGRRPFSGTSVRDTLNQILHADPPPVRALNPDIPDFIEQLISRCLRKDREERFQTSQDLLDELSLSASRADRDVRLHNIPLQPTRFVGREKDILEVKRELSQSRLVTLTGAGGIGKTRLALQVAGTMLAEFPNGVWFVELASIQDPGYLPRSVVACLGISEERSKPPKDTLVEYLKRRNTLIVLDNCEHLVPACAYLVDVLMRTCPGLRLLITSREILGTSGETIYRVAPLAVPQSREVPDLERLRQCDAVQLLSERIASIQPGFSWDEGRVRVAAEICEFLDGVPLSIELASARIRSLSLEQIRTRLKDCLHLLTSRNPSALPRQQTLRATMDWSFDLLKDAEQVVFRRLSCFLGSCTLEAAESVCSGQGIPERDVLNHLSQLVDKSLVLAVEENGVMRYRMLETIRQYGGEKLSQSYEGDSVASRHAQWFFGIVDKRSGESDQSDLWRDLDSDQDNIRATLNYFLTVDAEKSLRLAVAMWQLWAATSQYEEARLWLNRTLNRNPSRTPIRLKALIAVGLCSLSQPPLESAKSALEEAVAIAKELGDKAALARALDLLADVYEQYGDYVIARSVEEESLAISQESGDKRGVACSLQMLAWLAFREGDYSMCKSLVEKQLPISRELSDDWGLSRCFHLLGILARSSGDFQAARSWQEQAIERSKRTNARDTTAVELCTFASLLVVMNDLPAARSNCEEALAIAHSLGIADSAAFALKTLGYIAMHEGNFAQAQSLCKEALSISRSIGAAPRIASMLRTLANVSSATGEYAEAEALYKEALEITQSCDDKEGNANILGDLGLHYFTMRQYAKAGPLLHRSLSIFAALGDKEDVTCALTVLAGFSAETHDHNRAARLFGAVDAAYESMGIGLLPLDRLRYRYDGSISSLRNAMGESAFQSCWDEGRKVTLDSAVKLATE